MDMNDILGINPETQKQWEKYRRGISLRTITSMPGYQVLLDLMEEHCVEVETALMDADTADVQRVFALQKEARATRRMFHQVQATIEYYITLQEPTNEVIN